MQAFEAELGTMAGVDAVNAWVAEQTAGLIPNILARPIANPVVVLLNALHFKDAWDRPFNAKTTAPMPFRLVGGGAVNVADDAQTRGYAVREDERFIAVSLPYRTADGESLQPDRPHHQGRTGQARRFRAGGRLARRRRLSR